MLSMVDLAAVVQIDYRWLSLVVVVGVFLPIYFDGLTFESVSQSVSSAMVCLPGGNALKVGATNCGGGGGRQLE